MSSGNFNSNYGNNYSSDSKPSPIITSKKIESLKSEILDIIYTEKSTMADFKSTIRGNVNQILQKVELLENLTKE